ncbi:MAG: DUF3237 domain-containing protein [Firmicutes bacterium]|nr:DUF3237 domain-containing protein [Bacillota bacterium]
MKIEKLFDYEILQKEDLEIPGTAAGDILISPTSGGRFEGPKMRGEMLPIGLGLCYTHGPANDIQCATLLRTDDGCDILMQMEAVYDVDPDTEEKLIRGELVDSDSYYYKGRVTFQTGAAQYQWLQRKLCVCECFITDYTRLNMTVYMVK